MNSRTSSCISIVVRIQRRRLAGGTRARDALHLWLTSSPSYVISLAAALHSGGYVFRANLLALSDFFARQNSKGACSDIRHDPALAKELGLQSFRIMSNGSILNLMRQPKARAKFDSVLCKSKQRSRDCASAHRELISVRRLRAWPHLPLLGERLSEDGRIPLADDSG